LIAFYHGLSKNLTFKKYLDKIKLLKKETFLLNDKSLRALAAKAE